MTIYAFYIFDRHCSCIFARDYSANQTNKSNNSDSAQLLFGTIYSLTNLASKLGASDNVLRSFSTGEYRIHLMETLTKYRFALVSDCGVDSAQAQLWEFYTQIFVKNVVQNALMPVEFGDNLLTNSELVTACDKYISQLPIF